MLETIKFKDMEYPKFQSEGFAAQFIFPFALKVCKGVGYDIGYKKAEWKLPGAIGVEISENNGLYHALNFPKYEKVDYIFSSHCLEHIGITNWVNVLDYWIFSLKSGGVLFLYLPDYSQEYWRPWNDKLHLHIFTPEILTDYFNSRNDINKIFVSGVDLNNSFSIIVEKL